LGSPHHLLVVPARARISYAHQPIRKRRSPLPLKPACLYMHPFSRPMKVRGHYVTTLQSMRMVPSLLSLKSLPSGHPFSPDFKSIHLLNDPGIWILARPGLEESQSWQKWMWCPYTTTPTTPVQEAPRELHLVALIQTATLFLLLRVLPLRQATKGLISYAPLL
jgi:hypothetical protein